MLQGTDFQFDYEKAENGYELHIQATVKCSGKTGVEMEALTAVSVAALTFMICAKPLIRRWSSKKLTLLKNRWEKWHFCA